MREADKSLLSVSVVGAYVVRTSSLNDKSYCQIETEYVKYIVERDS